MQVRMLRLLWLLVVCEGVRISGSLSTGGSRRQLNRDRRRWVLTDAKCIDYRRLSSAMHNPRVHLGGIQIDGEFEEVHAVVDAKFHPQYVGDLFGPYNVALLKLEKSSNMGPVELWNEEISLNETRLSAVGWGRILKNGPVENRLLEIEDLKQLPQEECKLNAIPSEMDCFSPSSVEAFTGVAGIPVVASPPSSCSGQGQVLLGLARQGCICRSTPQAMMSMKTLAEWIEDTTA